MSVSSERLAIRTDNIIKRYLLNGEIPDTLVVEGELSSQLSDYYNVVADEYVVNTPLWEKTDLSYREPSDFNKWNLTQSSAAEDIKILYRDFISNAKTLTDRLAVYMMTANLIRVRVNKLLGRIENLLLLANNTDGFLYSFFDTFDDKSKVSYDTTHQTTAMVNVDSGEVELSRDTETGIPGIGWADEVINLQFLQNRPTEISFSVLNPTLSVVSLSQAELNDIFNNKAVAWQREITTTNSDPMVAQLTVRVSPLDPIAINRVEFQTKMSNYNNQLQVQVFYSQDGTSYLEAPSPSNPLYVTQAASLSFNTVYATHFRFLITKNVPDNGHTFVIGFQNINFIRTQYSDAVGGDTLYSIPITFPDVDRPIGRVACEVCESKPVDTDIEYFLTVSGNLGAENDIPITPTNVDNIKYSKIVDLGSFGTNESEISTADVSGLHQWALESGRLTIEVSDLTSDISGISPINLEYGDTIAQTLSVYRNEGIEVDSGYENNAGYRVPPSGLGEDYFVTNVLINNEAGSSIDFGATPLILDGKKVNGIVSLSNGLHQIATDDLYQHQAEISQNCDKYFAWNMRYVSPFEFYNDYEDNNLGIFTYNQEMGKVIINPMTYKLQDLTTDYAETFEPGERGDGSYLSSDIPLSRASMSVTSPSGLINAGAFLEFATDVEPGPPEVVNPRWVNEFQITLDTSVPTSFRVYASMDGIDYTVVSPDIELPAGGMELFGATIFDTPVYARYIKVYFITGSKIDLSNAVYKLFPPIFKTNYTLYTEPIYLPAGHEWTTIQDGCYATPSQAYTAHSSFSDETPQVLPVYDGTEIDMTGCVMPKLYFKIVGNSSLDPYVNLLDVRSTPREDERSIIKFSYHSTQDTEAHKQIRFKAVLKSNNKDITPKLQSYRVKIS
jgi:hypothetical protein